MFLFLFVPFRIVSIQPGGKSTIVIALVMKMERKEVDGQECRGIKAGPSGPQTAIMPALFPP